MKIIITSYLLLILNLVTFANSEWEHLLPKPTGVEIIDLKIIPTNNKLVAVGEIGTYMFSEDNGVTWNVTSNLNDTKERLNSISFIDSLNGIIVGNSGLIFKTTNGGVSWNNVSDTSTIGLTSIAYSNQSNIYAVGYAGKIIKSTDGGSSWFELNSNTNEHLYDIYFLSDTLGFAIGRDGIILKTVNSGVNWNQILIPNFWFDLKSIAFIDSSTGFIVGEEGSIFKTTDSGTTWIKHNTDITPSTLNSIFIRNSNDIWAAGDNGTIIRTSNGGNKWSLMVNNDQYLFDLNSIIMLDGYQGIAIGKRLVKTIDSGFHWNRESTMELNLNNFYFETENLGYITKNNGLYKTINGGEDWILDTLSILQNKKLNIFCSIDSLTKIITNKNSGVIYRTIDNGISWNTIQLPLQYPVHSIQFPTPNIGYIGYGKTIAKSIDGGLTWSNIYEVDNGPVKIHFIDSQIGYYFKPLGYYLYKTIDGGINWNLVYNFNSPYIPKDIQFYDNYLGFIACHGGKLLKTIDGGVSWNIVDIGNNKHLTSVYIFSPTNIMCAGLDGMIYKSVNGGTTWEEINSGTFANIHKIQFVDNYSGFLLGSYGTILKTTTGGEVVSISEGTNSETPQLPNTIQLLENYPNPFNPSTTINYELKKTNYELAKLSIFNVLGQKVREWILPSNSGKNSVTWDGTDNFGKSVSSGVYLYRLEIGNESQTKKMLLLK